MVGRKIFDSSASDKEILDYILNTTPQYISVFDNRKTEYKILEVCIYEDNSFYKEDRGR